MVRIKDVAEHAGVSTATVSRVINGKSARPRFREAVERSVKELGFHPNRQARLLRLQRSNEVALILPDIENPGLWLRCVPLAGQTRRHMNQARGLSIIG
jgi:LacI family transcriptional regulator